VHACEAVVLAQQSTCGYGNEPAFWVFTHARAGRWTCGWPS
jgi:hypothetical protein